MTEKIKKSWGKGPLKIYDAELECFVLEDGTTVLNKAKMMNAIGRPWKGKSRSDSPEFVGARNLQPFIREELKEMFEGISFKDGNRIIHGYNAEILPLVCNVFLEAREAGALTPSQLPIAQKCEILIRAFARIGIRALIYEQLGFEKFKHPEAFRMLIESYLEEEERKWSKEFPDEFFVQLDRIYGNNHTTSRNRPMYYAKFIRKYIYQPMLNGTILEELDKKNPKNEKGTRKHRLFQFLSEEKGIHELRSQIWQVIGVLKTSANKRKYEDNYSRLAGETYQMSIDDFE